MGRSVYHFDPKKKLWAKNERKTNQLKAHHYQSKYNTKVEQTE